MNLNFGLRESFIDRTLRNLKRAWKTIAGSDYDASIASSRPELPDSDLNKIREQISECIEGIGGEVSARARAAALGHVYLALNETGKKRFLKLLASDFDVNYQKIDSIVKEFHKLSINDDKAKLVAKLKRTLEAPRNKLLTRFNDLPEGVKFLVDMRSDIISFSVDIEDLNYLEQDLKVLLKTWFDIGFLELKRITWNTASAALLEKLIAYEAVHTIEGWDDLKNRLDSDRRCFAYFHPRMPDEPLIFVEVALVSGMTQNIQSLLNKNTPVIDPNLADTAIFYSISNAQKGLAGISFGNFLIKRVASRLASDFGSLKVFATLSPIPGFINWLQMAARENSFVTLESGEAKKISRLIKEHNFQNHNQVMIHILKNHNWVNDPKLVNALRQPLLRLAAYYLIHVKGKNNRALDSVAHFHLSNGARMERLNWMGDTSENGLKQSAGIMINYLYDLNTIEINHEMYADQKKLAVSSSIKSLVKS